MEEVERRKAMEIIEQEESFSIDAAGLQAGISDAIKTLTLTLILTIGMADAIKTLHSQGIRIGIATRNCSAAVKKLVEVPLLTLALT